MTVMTNEDEDFEILIEDDTPPEDKNRPVAPDESTDEEESEEEYSERVRRRIAKETAKLHAERRAKEAAIRERDQAVELAKQALNQGQALKHQANQYEQGYVYKARQAAEAQIAKATSDYTEALAEGNTAKMIEAQRAMIRAEQEKSQYEAYVPRQEEPAPAPQAPQQAQQPRVDADELRRQTQFIKENPWLNTDQEMTERALQIDSHIRNTNPHLVGTDAYYEFVSTLMRQQFPAERFGSASAAPAAGRGASSQAGVAPVGRGTATKSPRSITLSQSQLSLCKRLGITPQQYAAQLLKGKN
jgi:hypothetical protein